MIAISILRGYKKFGGVGENHCYRRGVGAGAREQEPEQESRSKGRKARGLGSSGGRGDEGRRKIHCSWRGRARGPGGQGARNRARG